GRRRGTTSSDPDLVLHDALPISPKPGPKSPSSGPKNPSGPRTPKKGTAPAADDVFDFSLDVDDGVDIGKEILSGSSKKSGGSKSPVRSPRPQPGSDSDVKLVTAGPKAGSDSDVKLTGRDSDVNLQDAGTKTPKV